MGSRALGELLLRPSTTLRTPTRFTPAWPTTRYISNTRAQQPPRQEKPQTATTPEVAASSPQPTTDDAASRAIDDLFAVPPSTTTTTTTPPSQPATSHMFGAEFSRPNPRGGRARPIALQFDDMAMPDSLTSPSLANKPTATSLAAAQAATFENYPRLNPTFGRSVDLDVSRGRDIVRGIGMLGSLMARNRVKSDFAKQKFHERGGLKRKRLNSERWRARFRKGFQSVTGRVVELTKKGW